MKGARQQMTPRAPVVCEVTHDTSRSCRCYTMWATMKNVTAVTKLTVTKTILQWRRSFHCSIVTPYNAPFIATHDSSLTWCSDHFTVFQNVVVLISLCFSQLCYNAPFTVTNDTSLTCCSNPFTLLWCAVFHFYIINFVTILPSLRHMIQGGEEP